MQRLFRHLSRVIARIASRCDLFLVSLVDAGSIVVAAKRRCSGTYLTLWRPLLLLKAHRIRSTHDLSLSWNRVQRAGILLLDAHLQALSERLVLHHGLLEDLPLKRVLAEQLCPSP